MKNFLKGASIAGLALAAAVPMATAASAAPPVPPAAVYVTTMGTPTATVPVYYKCTRRGCGYFFFRKYGTPIVYAPAPAPVGLPIIGSLLAIPGAVVSGTTAAVGGVVGTTTNNVLPALTLGLL